ncbi:unnamed protein product [Nesidiocoris tenuis]|uniref:Uncharacterized protein n=1 Tax=Nesidiocoris tenuis TaxID=355587 RepID=A0A6H5H9J6_9HEMI|nr:unnamed protein product [Nesidiocoris tenuis]
MNQKSLHRKKLNLCMDQKSLRKKKLNLNSQLGGHLSTLDVHTRQLTRNRN